MKQTETSGNEHWTEQESADRHCNHSGFSDLRNDTRDCTHNRNHRRAFSSPDRGGAEVTRYSELYHAEVEAHDRTKRNLVIVREQLENVNRFIRENRLMGKFARWALALLKHET